MEGTAAVRHFSDELLVPSINFSALCPGVFRSGYPAAKNFPFLRTLGLRSICYLCPEEYGVSNQKFCEENNIFLARFPMEGNKEPFVDIPETIVHRALSFLADPANHPVLIHCNKGKHRTGTICGCLRLLQGWAMVSIFQEYVRFAGDKARSGDQQFIELYHPVLLLRGGHTYSLASWVDLAYQGRAFTLAKDEAAFAAIVQQRSRVSLLGNDKFSAEEKDSGAGQAKERGVGGEGSSTPAVEASRSQPIAGSAPAVQQTEASAAQKDKKEKKDKKSKEIAT
jgi:tyrosine-protein phosphatase SIW14